MKTDVELVRDSLTQVGTEKAFQNILDSRDIEPNRRVVTLTDNGITAVNPATGFEGIPGVDITVNLPIQEEVIKETITSNGEYTIVPDVMQGYIALEKGRFTVAVPSSGGYGAITGWEGNKTYDSFTEAGELNWVNKFGALLWVHPDTGKIIANNAGTIQTWNPKSETASTPEGPAGYNLLGVCVGLGKWVYYDPEHAEDKLKWATDGSDRYNNFIAGAAHANGLNSTIAILVVTDTASDTIFSRIETLRKPEGDNLPVFLPSKLELLELQNNCCSGIHTGEECSYGNNIGILLSLSGTGYWTSSQAIGYSSDALKVRFNSCLVSSDGKSNTACKSVLFLHFGE